MILLKCSTPCQQENSATDRQIAGLDASLDKFVHHLHNSFFNCIEVYFTSGGDNEVQRTMLEIVNQLDGFDSRGNIKVWLQSLKHIYSTAWRACCGPEQCLIMLPTIVPLHESSNSRNFPWIKYLFKREIYPHPTRGLLNHVKLVFLQNNPDSVPGGRSFIPCFPYLHSQLLALHPSVTTYTQIYFPMHINSDRCWWQRTGPIHWTQPSSDQGD